MQATQQAPSSKLQWSSSADGQRSHQQRKRLGRKALRQCKTLRTGTQRKRTEGYGEGYKGNSKGIQRKDTHRRDSKEWYQQQQGNLDLLLATVGRIEALAGHSDYMEYTRSVQATKKAKADESSAGVPTFEVTASRYTGSVQTRWYIWPNGKTKGRTCTVLNS